MTKLNIVTDSTYYRSDSIEHGRDAKAFFNKLTESIFNNSYNFWKHHQRIAKTSELPLLYSERNLYSIFAASLNSISPIHLSEWSFEAASKSEKERRVVDFWCLDKPTETGKALNYFMELKKGWYCVSNGSNENMTNQVSGIIRDAIEQISHLKLIRPDWAGDGDVFMALPVIHGYYANSRDIAYNQDHLHQSIYDQINRTSGAQLISSTWILPEDMKIQWEKYQCSFISITGIVLTRKK